MTIRVLADARVEFLGELDAAARPHAWGALAPEIRPGQELTLELAGLTFMDSTGIHLLLDVLEVLGPEGRLQMRNPRPTVHKVLDLCGILTRPNVVLIDDPPD